MGILTLKEWLKSFRFFPIFPLLDVISTIMFTRKIGIQAESNFIGRFLMENFGNLAFPIMFFFATTILFLIFTLFYYMSIFYYKKSKKVKKEFKRIKDFQKMVIVALTSSLISIYTFTLYLNLSVFF